MPVCRLWWGRGWKHHGEPDCHACAKLFYGFTPFSYDVDPLTISAVVDDVYARLAGDADLVAHHFDAGVPWNAALADLLDKAQARNAEFITWFILQDYDQLCSFVGGCSDTDVLWRDSGLYDGFGNIRPAYTRWTDRLAIPAQ
ncbi:MAG: hypothetical protein BMS9Abin36_1597 [Gammaproteobacteria bacterium]|nr:MAG: hypothetical protein BMS9Abin36_1597 [Gammaproteobacteria bacterium]